MNKISRFFAVVTILWCLMILAGCTSSWVGEANNIIQLLGPAITAALSILTAFGAGVSPAALTAIQQWSQEATTGLTTVGGLIDQYNAADPTAKQGILQEIQTALSVIVTKLSAILPEIHITDPKTQAQVMAVIGAIQSEIQALINVVPALQGKVTSHDELKALVAKVGTASEFKADFNAKAGKFGKEYTI